MLRKSFALLSLLLFSTSAVANDFKWTKSVGDHDVSFVESIPTKEMVEVSGFSINQMGLDLDLRSAAQVILEEYPDVSSDWFIVDSDGNRRTVEPTVAEVWKILSKDPNVLGSVPIGYSETAGGSEIAGFYKIDGESHKSIFSAPNMDAVLCLDDLARGKHEENDFVVPFVFEVDFSSRFSFSYVDGISDINLDHLNEKDRWKGTFDSCRDMIQLGFRLIEPLHIMKNNGQVNRRPMNIPEGIGSERFPLTALMFDRNARFSFVRFSNESPISVSEILSSVQFQQKSCARSVSGASNCEIWATMLTAFDDAAMFIRTAPEGPVKVFGKPDVISPAVLVLRRYGGNVASPDPEGEP